VTVQGEPASIAAFIAARLGEWETAAKAAAEHGGTAWQADPERPEDVIFRPWPAAGELFTYSVEWPGRASHIALHDPGMTLGLVAELRAILAEHSAGHGDENRPAWPCPTLRHLAAIWAGYPGYNPRWKP
jgi:Family of unknown function (DUF6221)